MTRIKTILDPHIVPRGRLLPIPRAHQCEFLLNIGLFFDGTDNNMTFHPDPNTNTNVVRLWGVYRDLPDQGYFRHYISGVGTPFSEVDQTEAEMEFTAGATGAGGESRIIFGLLQLVNSVFRFTHQGKAELWGKAERAALCSYDTVPRRPRPNTELSTPALTAHQKILKRLGRSTSLVDIGEDARREFFSEVSRQLRTLVTSGETRPRISAIYIDVFGFSRGAAQARVFVNWLIDLLMPNDDLFGVPAAVRTLGLFDSVASVGATDALHLDALKFGNVKWEAATGTGHGDWATPANLKINARVQRCFHVAALHELRSNFPFESVASPDGKLPSNCEEVICPGVHSDVGGGYAPGEQGKAAFLVPLDPRIPDGGRKAIVDDQLKLSNLPLNWMYDAATQHCSAHPFSPWLELRSAEGTRVDLPSRFGLARLPETRKAVAAYFEDTKTPDLTNVRDAMRAHGLRYLSWRYSVTKRNGFEKLAKRRASPHLRRPRP